MNRYRFSPPSFLRIPGPDHPFPANAPKILLEIAGADHLTFAGMVVREYSSVGDLLAGDPRRRAIVEYTGAFLDWYLAEIPEAKQVLLILSPQIVSYVGDFAGE